MTEDVPTHEADYCDECNSHQVFEVVSRWTKHIEETDETTRWTVLRCPVCSSPRLYVQAYELSGYFVGNEFMDTSEWLPRHVLFPTMPHLSPHAPQKVRDDFDEAQRCLSVNANTAASMMLRRALEQICLDHGVDDTVSFGLAGKLKALEERKTITGDLGVWSSSIKEIGDDGAHSRDVSRTDAQEAARFLEAVADYLYTYRKQYEEFIARRNADS